MRLLNKKKNFTNIFFILYGLGLPLLQILTGLVWRIIVHQISPCTLLQRLVSSHQNLESASKTEMVKTMHACTFNAHKILATKDPLSFDQAMHARLNIGP